MISSHTTSLNTFVGCRGGKEPPYPAERDAFRYNPEQLVAHAKDIEGHVDGFWGTFYSRSEAQKEGQKIFKARMRVFIKDDRLLEGFTPKFEIGCEQFNYLG
jgi:hypothetical protein